MSLVGLCGAHRVGKTTLARAFAEKNGATFVQTSVSSVFADMGLRADHAYDFHVRLAVQEEILKRLDAQFAAVKPGELAVTDRTPLDLAMYTKADAGAQANRSDELTERFRRYITACFDVTNKRFAALVVVQPGIPLVAAEGKAVLDVPYIEHLNTVALGLSVDERLKAAHFYLPRYMTDLKDRVGAMEYALGRVRRRAVEQREEFTLH